MRKAVRAHCRLVMRAGSLLLLVGLLTLWAELTPTAGLGLPPRGRCPKAPPGTVTICLVKCKNDWSCHGPQKCCPYACLVDCMNPV
ncbi:hypothetical protein lerEdw1_014767 [Lerista edwardsae]|nr:hypothetical protein lerEdw1_014769 [Lerista edwardsae]KAJ6625918.1 hypothetical protein lerEdw1_014767 [Lerista edwardsae]